jgi:hypothetical protein
LAFVLALEREVEKGGRFGSTKVRYLLTWMNLDGRKKVF